MDMYQTVLEIAPNVVWLNIAMQALPKAVRLTREHSGAPGFWNSACAKKDSREQIRLAGNAKQASINSGEVRKLASIATQTHFKPA